MQEILAEGGSGAERVFGVWVEPSGEHALEKGLMRVLHIGAMPETEVLLLEVWVLPQVVPGTLAFGRTGPRRTNSVCLQTRLPTRKRRHRSNPLHEWGS